MKYQFSLALGTALALSGAPGIADESAPDEHHQLDEIIVSATPLPRTVEGLAQPTAVLTGDALTRRQSSSIGETLADELGVNSSYFGPIASRPVIRGQFGERIEMLSNGLSALDASALSEDHAVSLDSLLADRVEIIRGPATLLYGSGSAGGVVNIVDSRIHDTPLATPFSGALSLGTDSAIGKRSGAFKIDLGNENVAAHFDYMRRDTDNVEVPGFVESARLRQLEELEEPGGEEEEGEEEFGVVENTDSETESAAAAITFFGSAGRIGFSASRFETNYGIPGEHEHAEEEEMPGAEEEEEEIIRIDMEQTRYDIDGELYLSGFFESLKFKLALNDYQHVELEGPEVGTLYDNQGTDARFELTHRKIGLFEGAIGLQYKRLEFDAVGEEAFVPQSDTEQLSVFAFEEAVLSPALTIQASARIERQEISTPGQPTYSDTAAGAALGAIWSLSDALTLSGNLSVTERHPNSTELYANGPHLAVQRFERGSVTLGNGELDNERSRNLDLTLRGGFDRVEFSLTAFFNDVSDYVLLSPTNLIEDELQVFDFGQTDAELYGFEAEALVELYENLDSHFHIRLFSDVTRGKDTVSNANLPRIPPLRYGLSLHYRMANIDAIVSVVRNTEQDRVVTNELITDAYTMLNAELSYRLPEPAVLLFLKGTNLGDEDARRHSSPLKDLIPLPGRSVVAGVRWDF
ncbi:MAG: TonB-dependent receptor [Pseudomonadota bacterium]